MNRRDRARLTTSPLLVGAVTTLVTIIAVFIAYNANSGLPFVPTYDLRVRLPDAANLVKGNDVNIGGARVGTIAEIDPVPSDTGEVTAELEDQAGKAGRAAVCRHHGVGAAPLGPRPQVPPADAGKLEART